MKKDDRQTDKPETQRLQAIQDELEALQYGFGSDAPQFWALRLAWEAVRLARRVAEHGGDYGEIELVESAVMDYRKHSAPRYEWGDPDNLPLGGINDETNRRLEQDWEETGTASDREPSE